MESREIVEEALRLVVERCPRLVQSCYRAATSSIAIDELARCNSRDLDFHTGRVSLDVRPILAEVAVAFGDKFELLYPPDDRGSSFRGLLTLPMGKFTLEVLSNTHVGSGSTQDQTRIQRVRMTRSYRYVTPTVFTQCRLPSGDELPIPVVQGLLKHTGEEQLPTLLRDVDVLRKYTLEALRRAASSVVGAFPRAWLENCMRDSNLPEGRRRALEFMLG